MHVCSVSEEYQVKSDGYNNDLLLVHMQCEKISSQLKPH